MPKTKKKKIKITKPKELNRVCVIVEPKQTFDGQIELRTEVTVDGNRLRSIELINTDHFRSLFDYVWDRTKQKLDKALGLN